MTVYLPVYTHCSECGSLSGYVIPGPGFATRQEAEEWLAVHPNTSKRWGDGQTVVVVEVLDSASMLPVCGSCGECHYCCYGQA
jgi:hypothetical protein